MKYERPNMELIRLETTDMIITSPGGEQSGDGEGSNQGWQVKSLGTLKKGKVRWS